MKVVAVICRKGGVGKTTIATHLAVAAEKLGLVTVVFDLDPQASATTWGDHRGKGSAPAVIAAQSTRLPLLLKEAEDQEADLIILDTPPHADTTSTAAVAKADLVLIPSRPSGLDLEALPASIQLARISGKRFFVIINAAPVQGHEVAEAQAAFAAEGIDVAPIVMHQRKAYSSHWQVGQTAEESDPSGKAAAEIRELTLWLCEQLGMTKPPAPQRQTA
jgi:chromosome partitioning protein